MERIEEVKKILRIFYSEAQSAREYITDGYLCNEFAPQICQLFEPKPDESGLLTEGEISSIMGVATGCAAIAIKVAKAQLAKADKDYQAGFKIAVEQGYKVGLETGRRQERERIFKRLEKAYRHKDQHFMPDGMIDCEFRCVSEHTIEALKGDR